VLVLPANRTRTTRNAVKVVTPVNGPAPNNQSRVIGPGLLEQDQLSSPQGPRPTGIPVSPNTGGGLLRSR
jgi:hypothetical protein